MRSEKCSMTARSPPYLNVTSSKTTSPRGTDRSGAPGLSTIVAGRDSVFMPSVTVPMFSNSELISHMTQCEMPFSRSAIAVAAATAPTPTRPCDHSHSVAPLVDSTSSMLSEWLTSSMPLT
jgi:hypothetical protein